MRLVAEPENGVVLVAPRRASQREIDAFAAEHRDWIRRQTERLAEQRAAGLGLDRAGFAWIDGTPIPVQYRAAARASARVSSDSVACAGPTSAAAEAAVERLYRRLALERINDVIAVEAAHVGARPLRVGVGDTRSRWGSCTAKGSLRFSWRLILAPPDVLRYVVIHELCHLHRMDHSAAFWALVRDAMPAHREHSDWLREHGWELHAHVARVVGSNGSDHPLVPPV